MSSDIPDSVAKLIDLVIRNHEADWLGRQLERQGYLPYETLLAIREGPLESWYSKLEAAMYRLYAEVSPFEATVKIAHSEGTVSYTHQTLPTKA